MTGPKEREKGRKEGGNETREEEGGSNVTASGREGKGKGEIGTDVRKKSNWQGSLGGKRKGKFKYVKGKRRGREKSSFPLGRVKRGTGNICASWNKAPFGIGRARQNGKEKRKRRYIVGFLRRRATFNPPALPFLLHLLHFTTRGR